MFLDLASQLSDSPEAQQLQRMAAAGLELPGIVVLLATRPDWTVHWNQFTHEVMRGAGRLPSWQREVLAAVTSRCNHCVF